MELDVKNKLEGGLTFKVSRFKEVIKKTRPHKHDAYYELVFLSEGEGFHWIEEEEFRVTAPEFYLLQPGQVHYWQFTAVPKGFVVLFTEEELDALTERSLVDLHRRLSASRRVALTREKFPQALLTALYREYKAPARFSRAFMHGLLQALMAMVLQQAEAVEVDLPRSSLFDRFKSLLMQEGPRLHRVADYAEKLHTTPQNLNGICRRQAGLSAGALIAQDLLLEAKRYVLHTDLTMNEIADLLHFSDASHFVKFFKRHEGLTPLQFRTRHFK